MSLDWLCAMVIGAAIVAVVGHGIWVLAASILTAVFGTAPAPAEHPRRPFRYCPACGSDTDERDERCPQCNLMLDGRLARDLHRINVAEREIRTLADRAAIDAETAGAVLDQLEARARSLQGLPTAKPARPRAVPVAAPAALAPADAGELLPAPDAKAEPAPVPEPPLVIPAAALAPATTPPPEPMELPAPEPARHAPVEPGEPDRPSRPGLSSFLEEHNILWGELVGGLLIVGCSIALLVTLWHQLEEIRYFPFALSSGVTLALFGAGQYTLHRWKLAATSRGMLVISLLLTPLTLLLLSEPVAHGTGDALDIAVKLAAVVAFVGVVRTGGRDLIGTEHLPGPIDRRWLLSLAVVGATGTQLLPAAVSSAWFPLLCFIVAAGATLGGLSWYHPGRRDEVIADKSGTALLTFVGLALFALFAAWGLYLVREPAEIAARLRGLAAPLALASVPVVEAGVLVYRRVSSAGLRTAGTAVTLLGFLGLTTALALAWPEPGALLLVSAASGAFLTRVAFRERIVWVQIGAVPLLAFATVLVAHGVLGHWNVSADPSLSLVELLDSPESGTVLVAFALILGGIAELLARLVSRQTLGYALGSLTVGALGLVLVSMHGPDNPAPAAITHAAAAGYLLAANARWKLRSAAHGALWLGLVATLWALWAIVPRLPDRWGFVVAVEALALAAAAVALRRTHGPATALFRRAARDVSFGAFILAIFLGALSLTLRSDWHTGTLLALALAAVALARLTGLAPLTWTGSVAAFLGFVHLALHTCGGETSTLALETAVLAHATLATLAARACRRQARVFGDPLRWSALLSSVLAVPALFFPPAGLALVSAALAVWLSAVWLAFVLLWRERGAFSAFQGAITLAALLAGFAWIEQQPWWAFSSLRLEDPRALHAFGFALAALGIVWIGSRRMLQPLPRARELWCDNPLSLDRLTLAALVVGFLCLAVVAVVPPTRAELATIGRLTIHAPAELTHAFDSSAWWLLALLAGAVGLSWRLSKFESDTASHAIGFALLLLTAPAIWAGTHASETATASALRWGAAAAFVAGSVLIALRVQIRRGLAAVGFPVHSIPWLPPVLLVLVATAAGVVLFLSAQVAEIGLSRLHHAGPAERSVFALMGTLPSNLVPLALVVFGLALTAGRERSSGYALAGGLVFVLTGVAGYALSVVTAGKPLDGTTQTNLVLIAAASAAVWALAWLVCEARVPGGILLTVQVSLGFTALGAVCVAAVGRLFAQPGEPLSAAFDPLGGVGWAVLVTVAAAGFWHMRRAAIAVLPCVFGFVGLAAGALTAAALREFDVSGWWRSFYALGLVWAVIGFALLAGLAHSRVTSGVLITFATLLVLCALRSGWRNPPAPWPPVGLSLSAAVLLGAVAVRMRLDVLALASGMSVNLAAVLVWVAHGPDTLTGFMLANAAGVGAAVACWTLIRIRRRVPEGELDWLRALEIAPLVALGLLVLGLLPTYSAVHANPNSLAWGATAVVAIASAIGLWDGASRFAARYLYAVGVLATLLVVANTDLLPIWDAPLVSLALAAFVLGVAGLATLLLHRTEPVLRLPTRGDSWEWLLLAQVIVAASAILLGVRIELFAPSIWERLATPLSVAILAGACAVMTRALPEQFITPLRTTTVALLVGALGALAWAGTGPADPHAMLHRNAWLFVALAAAAVTLSEWSPRFGESWRTPARTVAGWTAVAALVVLCVNLLQQVPVFDPDPLVRRTPLTRESVLAILAAIAALFVLALRFALVPDRDPFELPPARRAGFTYVAELLLVLFFAQLRFNVPELFFSELAKLWTFVVMALAYVGIGLAELFERKKLDVLAVPLRRTGVLLPLVPLLAFWLKPPPTLSAFARHEAPGLGPWLGYLERLPQHFDTYAWLLVIAAGLYGLLALKRQSFGWALLAALATNAAMWSLLVHTEVPFVVHPQAWVIPLALIVLVSEHVNRHRLTEDVSNAMRYAGIAMIYVASTADMFIAGIGNSLWLPVVLAVLCVIGVIAGIMLRVRAFVYLGVAFLVLDVFSMIWHAAVDLQQTWVWYVSGIILGVLVLALFAYLEKRRTHAESGE
jgi:hypothetical protein